MASMLNAMIFFRDAWLGFLIAGIFLFLPAVSQRFEPLFRSSFYTESYEIRDFMIATPEEAGEVYQDLLEQVVQLIEDVVASDSWKDRGGTGTIDKSHRGMLLITQTSENHAEVRKLMDQLRETRIWDGRPFHDYDWHYFRRTRR